MSRSAIAIHTTPAAVITHTVATIRGQQLADLSVYHARTPDVSIKNCRELHCATS